MLGATCSWIPKLHERSRDMRNFGLAIVVVMGAAALFLIAGGASIADQPKSAATKASPAATASPAAVAQPLEKLTFLEGTWRGTMDGDAVEEIWSAPSGDSLAGIFRWVSSGKTTLYELLSIKAEGDDAVLRLRHFNGKFEPWKGECDGVAALRATKVEPGRVLFENAVVGSDFAACEFLVKGDVLFITVRFGDPKQPTLEFELMRVKGA